MNQYEDYTPSGFTKKDYQRLAEMNRPTATQNSIFGLNSMLRIAQWRDKRIQRRLKESWDRVSLKAFTCPLEDVPLYLGRGGIAHQLPSLIAAWRLELGK